MEKGFKMKNETEFEFDEILGMGFTTVPNGIFESDLTFNAIGIYCTIIKMKNANGWKVYQSTLVSDKNGRTKVMNGMKELIEKGWIEKVQLRDEKGRLNGVKYIIRSMPTAFLPKSEKPTSGNPTSKKPNSDNVPLQIKTNTNKENTNKKNTNKYTTQQQVACSSNAVNLNNSCITEIENNTHLKLSNNQFKKVSNWEIDRLRKAIAIFKEQQGQYFALLEKIYLDNGNFVPKSNKSNTNNKVNPANFTQREYDYDKLEKQLLGWETPVEETEESMPDTEVVEVETEIADTESNTNLFIFLEDKIAEVALKTWIIPNFRVNAKEIILTTTDTFIKNIIAKRYLEFIQEFASKTGKTVVMG